MRPSARTKDVAWPNVLSSIRLKNERPNMSDVYAMQRANGDWFALDDHGRLRVPLFHSSHDAMMARLRNFGLLLFKPIMLDERFLKEIVPLPGEDEADFCMVVDPFDTLKRGTPLERAELVSLMRCSDGHQNVERNGNTFPVPDLCRLPQSDSEATETWEDEGGSYAKCA
jgi:hypothetical protein